MMHAYSMKRDASLLLYPKAGISSVTPGIRWTCRLSRPTALSQYKNIVIFIYGNTDENG